MLQSDYYQLLGVSRQASDQQITKGFRKQILKYHPDKNQNQLKREECMKKSMEIVEAYQILKHKESRLSYDQYTDGRKRIKQGHLEEFNVQAPKGCSIEVEYQCEQCFGITGVSFQISELFSYVVACSHCGLRTLISINHIL